MEISRTTTQNVCWKGEFTYSQESISCSMIGNLLKSHSKNGNVSKELTRLHEIKSIELKSIPGLTAPGKLKTFMCTSTHILEDVQSAYSFIVIAIEPSSDVERRNDKHRLIKNKLNLATKQYPVCIAHFFPLSDPKEMAVYIIPAHIETKLSDNSNSSDLRDFYSLYNALDLPLDKSGGNSPHSSFVRAIFIFKNSNQQTSLKVTPTTVTNQTNKVEENLTSSTLRVSNLDVSISQENAKKSILEDFFYNILALEKEFGLYGTIKNIEITYYPKRNSNNKKSEKVPVGFVTYETAQQAEKALSHLSGLTIGGRHISISLYFQKPETRSKNGERFKPY